MKVKQRDYKIVESFTVEQLIVRVKEAQKDDWVCIGGMIVDRPAQPQFKSLYSQTMVKYEDTYSI